MTVQDSIAVEGPKRGGIAWFDWHDGQWWIGRGQALYCYTQEWELIGFWRLPRAACGGTFFEGHLFAADCKSPKINVYRLPPEEVRAELIKTIETKNIPKGMEIEVRDDGRLYLWSADDGDVNVEALKS